MWHSQRIGVLFLRERIDTSRLDCEAVRLMSAIAQLDRLAHGDIAATALKKQKENGRPVNAHAGLGFAWKTVNGQKQRVVDKVERRQMSEVVAMREDGKTFDQIYFDLLRRKIRRRDGREWSRTTIQKAAEIGLELREQEAAQSAVAIGDG